MGFEFDACIGNFGMQGLDLKTAGIGENGVGPVHKFVDAA